MVLLVGVTILAVVPAGPGTAAPNEPATEKLPPELALIPGESLGFVSIRLADLWNDEGTKGLRAQLAGERPDPLEWAEALLGVAPGAIERLSFVLPKTPKQGEPPLATAVLLVTTLKPYDQKKVVATLGSDARERKRDGRSYHAFGGRAVYLANDTTFATGATEAVLLLMDQAGKKPDGPLAAALAAAGKHHVVGAFRPAALVNFLAPMLPPEAGHLTALLEARSAVVTLDLAREAKAEFQLVYDNAADAEDAAEVASAGLILARRGLPLLMHSLKRQLKPKPEAFMAMANEIGTGLKAARVERKDSTVAVSLTVKANLAAVSRAAQDLVALDRDALRHLQSRKNLDVIGLAFHNHASANQDKLPADIFDKAGKPLLSWRVAILPYMEEVALYKQFHHDEPWDSAHNKKLIEKMPRVYAPVGVKAGAGETFYQTFTGKNALFEPKVRYTIGQIPDGTANTGLVFEAGAPVIWSKPADMPFDEKKPLPKLGGLFGGECNVLLLDGSVIRLRKGPDEKELKNLIMPADGGVIDFEKLQK